MEGPFARFGRRMGRKDFAANLADGGQPITDVQVERVFQRAAKFLGEGRAVSRGGNCDLEISSAHYGREIKITIRRIVDGVAENSTTVGFSEHFVVQGKICGGGEGEKACAE